MSIVQEKTLLKYIDFQIVENWSVQYLQGTAFSYNKIFHLVKIGEFLIKNTNLTPILDDTEYKRVTVKMNNKGVTLRDIELGKNIGTKRQFIVAGGEFIMSKIDARNGAFGIIPPELKGAIVTNDFPTYHIDTTKLNPDFFVLLTSTDEFLGFAQQCSSGTTGRQRINMDQFLNVRIPIPPLDIQDRIVTAHQHNIGESDEARKRANKLEGEIEKYLMEELGIKESKGEIFDGILRLIDSSLLEKWGIKYVLNGLDLGSLLSSSKFQMKKMRDIVDINPKTSISTIRKISFIPMRFISDECGEVMERQVIDSDNSGGYTKFVNGDLIWARITPCMQNGKSAIVENLENGMGCGSTEYHVIRNHDKNISMKYIHFLLRQKFLLNFATNYFTGSAGQQRVPKEFLEDLQIPLPSLEIQEKIVAHIGAMKDDIRRLRSLADELRETAGRVFEEEIFS